MGRAHLGRDRRAVGSRRKREVTYAQLSPECPPLASCQRGVRGEHSLISPKARLLSGKLGLALGFRRGMVEEMRIKKLSL